MTPLPGYRFANWEQGYGDFAAVPDLDHAAPRAVAREDGARAVRPRRRGDGESPVEVSPRQILRRQVERAAALGYTVKSAPSSSSSCSRTAYERGGRRRATATSPRTRDCIEDYHILQTTRDEYLIRQIRNGMDAAGVPVEFSKGEAGRGQHEINLALRRRARDGRPPRDLQERGQGDRRSSTAGRITFMAKYSMDEVGSSCHIHSSVWDADGDRVAHVGRPRAADHMLAGVPRLARRPARRRAASWRGCSPRT